MKPLLCDKSIRLFIAKADLRQHSLALNTESCKQNSTCLTFSLIRCCAFSPAPATIVRPFLIIICVGKSFCCHCQSLTAATIGSDRWKRQINSRLILEFEVLPSWHEQTAFFKSAYFTGNVASPGRWTN